MPLRVAIWLLLLFCAAPLFAARVVVVTLDRTPPSLALTQVPTKLAPHGGAAMALMTVRTAQDAQLHFVADGYLTINAGVQTRSMSPLPAVQLTPRQLSLAEYGNALLEPPPAPGALGDALHAHGLRTGAIGSVEALALLMDGQGTVDIGDTALLHPTSDDAARVNDLLAQVDVAAIDATVLLQRDPQALHWLSALITPLPEHTTILLCSPNGAIDPGIPWTPGWAVLLRQPKEISGLYSPSTRRSGLIANTDIASSIAAWAGVAETVGIGRPVYAAGHVHACHLLAIDRGLRTRTSLRKPVFLGFVIGATVLLALMTLAAFGWHSRRQRVWRGIVHTIAVLIPAGWLTLATTGFRPTSPQVLAQELLVGAVLALAIIWFFRRQRVPALWLATAAVILLGNACSREWNLFNFISFSALKDGRFYGLGNPAAGLTTAGVLVLAVLGIGWGHTLARRVTLWLPWAAAGWIFWSSGAANFGMGIATGVMAGTIFIISLPRGLRVRWFLATCVLGMALLGGLVWIDVGTGSGSHIARLVGDITAHGLGPLWTVMERKGLMAWKLLQVTDWTYMLLFSYTALVVLLEKLRAWYPDQRRVMLLLGAGLAATLAALALNDSGVEPAGILASCMVTCFVGLSADACEPAPAMPMPADVEQV